MNFEGLKLKRGFKCGENKEILCTYNPFILHGTFSKPKKPGLWYPIDHYWNASITGTNISSLQFFLYTWWGTLIVSSLPSSMIFSSSSSVSMLPDSLISKFVKGQIVNSPAHKVKKIVMDTSMYLQTGKNLWRNFFYYLLIYFVCI